MSNGISVEQLLVDGLQRMENKIDKLDSRLDDVDKTLVKQQASLDLHIYRTDLLEKHLAKFETKLPEVVASQVETHIKKMDKARTDGFKSVLKTTGKVLGALTGSGIFGFGSFKFLVFLSKILG